MYDIIFSTQAKKDIEKLSKKDKKKLKDMLLNIVKISHYDGKKLSGELKGYYSLRINFKDRLVYRVNEEEKIVYVVRGKTHYWR